MIKTKENLRDKLPKNFYWRTYLKLNPDLNQSITKKETINHYLSNGIIEGRKYFIEFPKKFNWKAYIYLNKDLEVLKTKADCVTHYLKEGFYEKREYEIKLPDNFNWEYYLQNNPDLSEKITNEKMAIKHYLSKGIFENRSYFKQIDSTKELFNLPCYYLNQKYDNNNLEIYKDNNLFDQLHENDILKTISFYKDSCILN
jgi:hypothetical protein